MRGKHGAIAERRREEQQVAADIEAYKHANARLVAENKRIKDAAAGTESALRGEIRALRAHLNEGLSPELLALRSTVDRLRDERDAARRDAAQVRDKWARAMGQMHAYVMQTEGGTGLEAMERLSVIVGVTDEGVRINTTSRADATGDAVGVIQRARGERRKS